MQKTNYVTEGLARLTSQYQKARPLSAPGITSISPSSGTDLGGTAVTITGMNLTGATAVTIGGTACTSVVVVDSAHITCVTPAHAFGTFDVVVTTPNGVATLPGGYTMAWAPTDISGLQAWYRADLGVSIGTGVSAWADQSGNVRNLTQPTGSKQPTVVANNATYNSQTTLHFNAAASQELDSGAWASIASPYSIFVVGNAAAIGNYGYCGGTANVVEFGSVAGDTQDPTAYAGVFLDSGIAQDTAKHVFGATFQVAGSVWRDNKTAIVTGSTGTNALSDFQVGKDGAGSHFLTGDIAEICIYVGALSAPNLASLFAYFGARYAIAIGP